MAVFAAVINLSDLDGSNGFVINGIDAGDYSGRSVSSAGDINGDGFDDVIIGAREANGGIGEAYVVFGSADGFTASLNLSDLDGNNGFLLNGVDAGGLSGHSVSSAGDVNGDGFDDIIIGAYKAFDFPVTAEGESYVVFGTASGFGASFDLSSLDGTNGFKMNGINANDYSGHAVSSAGDFNGDGFDDVLVTARLADPGGTLNAGSTYLVFGSGSAFAGTLDLATLNGVNGIRFDGIDIGDISGFAVGSAGDVNGDGFDDIIIGAQGADADGVNNAGESYVVFGAASGLGASFNLSNLDGANGFRLDGEDVFGFSGSAVSSAGDINNDGFDDVVVGAFGVSPGSDQEGRTYVIFGKASGFAASLDLSSLDGTDGFALNGPQSNNASGISVSEAGDINGDGIDDILVGSTGATYVVYGNATGFAASIDLTDLDSSNGFTVSGSGADLAGLSVSAAGDVNGDGFDDIIIGAMSSDTNGNNTGASHVLFGKGANDFPAILDLAALGAASGTVFNTPSGGELNGYSVSSAGDVNGDGLDDVLIGASGADPYGTSSGSTYLVFGAASGFEPSFALSSLDGTNGFRINGVAAFDSSGRFVSSAGDMNGDGFDDVVIGAPYADQNGNYSGSSYVVFGAASGFGSTFPLSDLNGSNGFRIDGEAAEDYSGNRVSSAGDVNGDGFDDILIGAFGADTTGVESGASYVVFGAASGFGSTLALASLDGTNGFRIDGAAAGDASAESVSSAGDVNGDGIADILIGASDADLNGNDSGSSYMVFGAASGFGSDFDLSSLDGTNGFRIDGVAANDYSGRSVSSAGDVNGDGLDDFVIGAPGADSNGGNSGSSYVVFGTVSGFGSIFDLATLDGANGFRIDGAAISDNSGGSVSSAGDVNGDGFDDIIIGAILADPGGNQSGASYVVFGAASGFGSTFALSGLDGANGFRVNGSDEVDFVGRSVSSAGDANGDGFDDVLIGAPYAGPNSQNIGETYLIYGRAPTEAVTRIGAAGDQIIRGGAFNDTLNGLGGNDELFGAGGNDTLLGGTGADMLFGGDGDDTLDGEEGGDTLDGGSGNDTLRGGIQSDTIFGGTGNDTIEGANGGDTIDGGAGKDNIVGQGGSDDIDGKGGADTISGGDANDTIRGGGGADIINGNDGSDTIFGGGGADIINGGKAKDNIKGQGGDDIINGNSERDTLTGGGGDDTILGGSGNDILKGQTGDDILNGQQGNDTLTGNAGNDIFVYNGQGDDTITDMLSGNPLRDQIDVSSQGFANFAAVMATASQVGGSVVFSIGGVR